MISSLGNESNPLIAWQHCVCLSAACKSSLNSNNRTKITAQKRNPNTKTIFNSKKQINQSSNILRIIHSRIPIINSKEVFLPQLNRQRTMDFTDCRLAIIKSIVELRHSLRRYNMSIILKSTLNPIRIRKPVQLVVVLLQMRK